jgi:transposase
MPWKASSVMEERLRFVARVLDGEPMKDVCREFGISRKTSYKIYHRYKEHGLEALSDRSRRPVRNANQLPVQLESLIVRLKTEKPHWGARKIRELLVRRLDGDVRVPAKSTIHAVLDRHGLVKRAGAPRHRARGTPLSEGTAPNDLWCADYKGEFMLTAYVPPRGADMKRWRCRKWVLRRSALPLPFFPALHEHCSERPVPQAANSTDRQFQP